MCSRPHKVRRQILETPRASQMLHYVWLMKPHHTFTQRHVQCFDDQQRGKMGMKRRLVADKCLQCLRILCVFKMGIIVEEGSLGCVESTG